MADYYANRRAGAADSCPMARAQRRKYWSPGTHRAVEGCPQPDEPWREVIQAQETTRDIDASVKEAA